MKTITVSRVLVCGTEIVLYRPVNFENENKLDDSPDL
jgi:hypothetical protein